MKPLERNSWKHTSKHGFKLWPHY